MDGTFEYKIVKHSLGWKGFKYDAIEEELNALGAEGWEAVDTLAPGMGAAGSLELVILMKRARA